MSSVMVSLRSWLPRRTDTYELLGERSDLLILARETPPIIVSHASLNFWLFYLFFSEYFSFIIAVYTAVIPVTQKRILLLSKRYWCVKTLRPRIAFLLYLLHSSSRAFSFSFLVVMALCLLDTSLYSY